MTFLDLFCTIYVTLFFERAFSLYNTYLQDSLTRRLYDAKNHQLTLIAAGDYRGAVAGGQAFVKTAPVSLVLISDLSRFGDAKSPRSQLMGAMDAGIVSQNISIFCSAANLATVPRASMDNEQLKKVLKLKDSQMPMMNHPVGYFK